MAITVTNGTSVGATGAANLAAINVDAPALTTSQIHIIAVTVNATGATITTPTGYTSLGTTAMASISGTASTTSSLFVFYRRGVASAGSVTITSSGGAGRISAVPLTVSGVDTTTPIQTSATSQSLSAPSVTATGTSLLVTAYAVREGTTAGAFTITQASGMTERGDVVSSLTNSTTQCGTEVATLSVAAGATGVKTATTSANTGYISGSMSIIVNEGTGGATEPPPTGTTGGFIDYLKTKFGSALTHYYPLNNTYQAKDVVGTLNGTVTGSVSFTSTGAVFSGAANNYITIPDNNDFSVTGTSSGGLGILVCQSVSDWASTSNLRSDGFVHWMGKGQSGAHEWTFRYYPSSDASRPKRTSFYHYVPSGGLGTGSYIQDDDANNAERVIVAQCDITTTTNPTGGNGFGTGSPGGTFLYKNGTYRESDGFVSGGGGSNIVPVNTASPVTIGCRNDKDSWQKGKIRRVAFFNRKLTAAEVTDIQNNMSLPEDGTGGTVVNAPPSASLSTTTPTLNSGQTINLSGASSADSDGTIATYNFTAPSGITLSGTGSSRTATAPTVTTSTNYTFGLTVTDNSGAGSSISNVVVTVLPTASANWTIPYDTRTTGFLRTVNVSTKAQLDAALADLRYGDKVVLAAGTYTYTANLVVTTPPVGSYSRTNPPPPTWITGPATAIINRTSTTSGYALNLDNCNFVTLNGFSVKGGQKCMIADESNNNIFQYMDFGNSGMELFHLRNYSSYNKILSCVIHHADIDGGDGGTGEGLYVGQSESNWGASYSRTGGAADTSNYNEFYDCDVLFALSECVDIKEGTTGTVVRGCTFDMSKISGENSADSAMDVKGNSCIIEDNIAVNPSPLTVDGIQTHILYAGYGNDNKFARNKSTLNGTGYCVNVQLSGSRGTATGNVVYSNNVVTNGTGVSNIALTGAPAASNQQPTVALNTNSPGTGWQGGNTVTISATASDPDGSIASYSWSVSGGTLVGTGASRTFKAPYDPAAKTYTVSVSVVDNLGLASTVKTVSIPVKSWPNWYFPNGTATPFRREIVQVVSTSGFGLLAFGNSAFGGDSV